jgi:signal peptidase I
VQRERTQRDEGQLVDVGRSLAASLLGDIDLTVGRRERPQLPPPVEIPADIPAEPPVEPAVERAVEPVATPPPEPVPANPSLAWAAELMASLPWDVDDEATTLLTRRRTTGTTAGNRTVDTAPALPSGERAPDPPRIIVIERGPTRRNDDDDGPSIARSLAEWVMVIAAAVGAALLIQAFAFRIYEIPSDSMATALENGDRVVVNKLSYSVGGDIGRGDVIVFDNPERRASDPDTVPERLIKRVIGLPGDVVSEQAGRVQVNGEPLDEPYLAAGTVTIDIPEPIVVGDDQLLVLGDHRENSHDGRFFGPIEQDTVVGRATTIVWPPGRFGML